MSNYDTIVAQVTPYGYSGVSILRISGDIASDIAYKILGRIPKPRYAEHLIFNKDKNQPIDKGIALWFPKPYSFTGEDILELHCHGNPVIIDIILTTIVSIPNVRLARPGEFSERAFLNGKIDLTQAEAIMDLINANSDQYIKLALGSLRGDFSNKIEEIIEVVSNLRTNIEASIDFPNDVVLISKDEIDINIKNAIDLINLILIQSHNNLSIQKGLKIVITGNPNVGKSTLFNSLVGYESAIVTDIPGTTRDLVRENIKINNVPTNIIDTAGLRETDNEIEKIGIKRAWEEIKQADVLLVVLDSTVLVTNLVKIYKNIIKHSKQKSVIFVRNKIDLIEETAGIKEIQGYTLISVSARTGLGMDILTSFLKSKIKHDKNITEMFLIKQRHVQALKLVSRHLKDSIKFISSSIELVAEELRKSHKILCDIVGKDASKELIKQIFSNFCIGK